MKKTIAVSAVVSIFTFIVGYFIGNLLPLKETCNGTDSDNDSQTASNNDIPKSKGRLVVSVVNTNNEPVIGIEIDVATQPGPPEDWGVKEANISGVVEYNLDPGTYYVFFNMNRFPNEYIIQPEKQATVVAGEQQEVKFVLEKK